MVNFGNRVKMLRIEKRLTQKQLADQVGVAVSAVSSYESGNRYPSYEVLINLARIFHVSTDYLLGLNKRIEIDVSGLEEEEIDAVTQIVTLLRNHNKN
ncbi:MAG: helix-turn-helix domain-containing protein [Oscillospiraceae bacterium]|jgi:transcriptional regulator with XRE-family HTH domain